MDTSSRWHGLPRDGQRRVVPHRVTQEGVLRQREGVPVPDEAGVVTAVKEWCNAANAIDADGDTAQYCSRYVGFEVDANGDLFIAWTRVVMGVKMNDNVFLPASELREKYDDYEGLVDEINEAVGTTLGDAFQAESPPEMPRREALGEKQGATASHRHRLPSLAGGRGRRSGWTAARPKQMDQHGFILDAMFQKDLFWNNFPIIGVQGFHCFVHGSLVQISRSAERHKTL